MPASTDARHSEPGRSALEYCVFILVALAACLAVTTNHADADLWGHVQYGRDLLEQGLLPDTASYTYTAEGYRWINHENLAEISMALVDGWFGPLGLVIGKTLLVYLVLALIIRAALRRGVGLVTLSIGLLVIAVNLALHVNIRPQLFTYFFFAIMLSLLSWCFEGWEGTWSVVVGRWGARAKPNYSPHRLYFLWLGVPLFAIWANTHGGFVAGLFVWFAYLGLRGVEGVSFSRAAWRDLLPRLGMLMIAAALATVLNPYGIDLHMWLFKALVSPRPEIAEWHPPHLDDPMSYPFWLLLVVIVIAVGMTRRSRDFTQLCVMLLLIVQAMAHQRHACFVALGFAFWCLPYLDSVLSRFGASDLSWLRAWNERASVRNAGIVVATGLALMMGWRAAGRLTDLVVARDEFPVEAVRFMSERGLEGNLVAHFDWAQYLIAAAGARDVGQLGVRLAFDGRFRTCYPQSVIDAYFDFALGNLGPEYRNRDPSSGRYDDAKILSLSSAPHEPAELVLIAKWLPLARRVMREHEPEWVLLYQDNIAELWGRASRYDNPSRPEYVPPGLRELAGAWQAGTVTWPALPSAIPRSRALTSR